jgi:hypothetical protein
MVAKVGKISSFSDPWRAMRIVRNARVNQRNQSLSGQQNEHGIKAQAVEAVASNTKHDTGYARPYNSSLGINRGFTFFGDRKLNPKVKPSIVGSRQKIEIDNDENISAISTDNFGFHPISSREVEQSIANFSREVNQPFQSSKYTKHFAAGFDAYAATKLKNVTAGLFAALQAGEIADIARLAVISR